MKRINLLPRTKQQELSYERVFYSVAMAAIFGVLIMLLGVVAQFGAYVYLDRKDKAMDTEIEQLKGVANKTENAEIKKQIRVVNAQIDDFTKLSSLTPQWSEVVSAFIKNIPADVKITQFSADTETGVIDIQGFSPTRDLVIDLYNNIKADKEHFENINYPLGNVTKPTNVRFLFNFTVAKGILVKEVK